MKGDEGRMKAITIYQPWASLIAHGFIYFGDFTPGRYAWELDNVRLIDSIPAKGQQGIWNWEGENV
jgi:hypothetical protein